MALLRAIIHRRQSFSVKGSGPLAMAAPLLQCAPRVRHGLSAVGFLGSPPRQYDASCSTAATCDGGGSASAATAARKVVVVESLSKARALQACLGGECIVLPTLGRVRDLAGRTGSVRPEEDYALLWEVPSDALDPLNKIKAAIPTAEALVLATDPDRQGEAVAWHVHEYMKEEGAIKNEQMKVLRVTFNEITKSAVLRAMDSPRSISMPLVNSHIARRAIDHLIGFGLSPLLWRKLPGSRSAERVQLAAMSLLCDKEKAVEDFVPKEYWTVKGDACIAIKACADIGDGNESLPFESTGTLFPVVLTHADGINLKRHPLDSEFKARAMNERLSVSNFHVSSIRKREKAKKPPMPYITSTLQQDSFNKLRLSSKRTMVLAQQLYEGVDLGNGVLTGLITFMHTDRFQLAENAVKDIRAFASKRYGEEYIPVTPPVFKNKVKDAQEAHEAIRPTDIHYVPSVLVNVLDEDALRLYSLIWSRTMACQMKGALFNNATIQFTTEDWKLKLQLCDSSLCFSGFLTAIHDNDANLPKLEEALDATAVDERQETKAGSKFPELKLGDKIVLRKTDIHQHFTRPPLRFSEASFVMRLEELGIGRPSTYAQVLEFLQSKHYVKVENSYIFPEVLGQMVTAFLSRFFPKFTDYKFSAKLEEQLDDVSAARIDWKDVLRGFWPKFKQVIDGTMQVPLEKVVEQLQETFVSLFFKGLGMKKGVCPSCMIGKVSLKLSRYGKGYFFACDKFPSCRFKADVISCDESDCLDIDLNETEIIKSVVPNNDRFVGVDPKTGRSIIVRLGPFGHYIQLGDDKLKIERLCFRIPEAINPHEITVENAVDLMKYPLSLGAHPEDGDPVWLAIGRGSFVLKHRAATVPMPKDVAPDDISLAKALELLKGDNVKYRGRKTSKKVKHKENKQGSERAEKLSNLPQKIVPKKKLVFRNQQGQFVKAKAKSSVVDKKKPCAVKSLITNVNQSGNQKAGCKKTMKRKAVWKSQVMKEAQILFGEEADSIKAQREVTAKAKSEANDSIIRKKKNLREKKSREHKDIRHQSIGKISATCDSMSSEKNQGIDASMTENEELHMLDDDLCHVEQKFC